MIKEDITKLISKLSNYRQLYNENEMAVRDQIINPMLRMLGWDTENPDEVRPNMSMDEGIPDYSLFKNNRRVLLLESKKLSLDIERKEVISQLAKYCFGEGVNFGVLTNGARWLLFRAYQEGTRLNERIIWKIDLIENTPEEVLLKLRTISKVSIENIDTLLKQLNILDEVWGNFLDNPDKIIDAISISFNKTLEANFSDYRFESAEVSNFLSDKIDALVNGKVGNEYIAPQDEKKYSEDTQGKMKIAGESLNYSKAYQILINTAEWLIKKGRLKPSDCPIRLGKKRYIISREPRHTHRDFINPKKLSNGLFVETNISRLTAIEHARQLLKHFGFNEDTLVLK